MKPAEIIPQFDTFPAETGLTLEAIATGGAALALLGIISRETRDCDLIEPELTAVLVDASVAAQDQHPDWPIHVHATLEDLAQRLGHGL